MVSSINSKGVTPFGVSCKLKKNVLESRPINAQLQTLPSRRIPLHAHRAYSKISFGSTLVSHKSWGAAVKATGDVNFKLLTWTDAKKVFVEISDALPPMQKFTDGFIKVIKNISGDIADIVPDGNKSRVIELTNMGEGVFEKLVDPSIAKHGEDYRFLIVKGNNEIEAVNDPYAMKQKSIHGWSTVYDHNKYQWGDKSWMDGKVKERISHISQKTGLKNPSNMRIVELHIPTLTKEGTFEAAKKEIDKLAEEKIVNTIEIMPVENTHSINWGYDGVNKFAPADYMGGPDKLKELIDYAHQKKINVTMDFVPNHSGPDGYYLNKTGPYYGGDGPFGPKLNYEGKDNKYVREYITNAALLWARDYHCDVLRLDMTKYMESDYTMKQIAAEVNYHHPNVVLIAEDGRGNDPRVTRPLEKSENEFASEDEHVKYIDTIRTNNVSLDNLGYDLEWNFPFHKQIASAILGTWEDFHRNMHTLYAAIKSSVRRIIYPMSHDEVGNMDGTRLITKSVTNDLRMFYKVEGSSNSKKGQRAAQSTQALLTALATGEADRMTQEQWAKYNQANNIKETIPLKKLKEAYKKALNKHKLALGQTFVTPSPKMLLQGDQYGFINLLKFFRIFSDPKIESKTLEEEKGYRPGMPAFYDSKLSSIEYSQEFQRTHQQIKKFLMDLTRIIDETPALQEGIIKDAVVHESSSVIGMLHKAGKNEVFTVSNYSDYSYNGDYNIKFPRGKWQEVLNSNSEEYAGSGEFSNLKEIDSKGHNHSISLPANSIVIFKKIT